MTYQRDVQHLVTSVLYSMTYNVQMVSLSLGIASEILVIQPSGRCLWSLQGMGKIGPTWSYV